MPAETTSRTYQMLYSKFSQKVFVFLFLITLLTQFACSKYNKALKSTDYNLKLKIANEYYDKGDNVRANSLYEQVYPILRGSEQGEECLYRFSQTFYRMEDYLMAGHYFRRLVANYPESKYAEEVQYLSAYCYYLDSPKPSLDQSSTQNAIDEFEVFLSRYPNSSRVKDCNGLMDECRAKLAEKTFKGAKLYFDLRLYKAASVALRNCLKKYPDTKYKEDILFLTTKSDYLFADNSIVEKQKVRFEKALNSSAVYKKSFADGKYLKDCLKIEESIDKKLKKLNIKI